MKSALILIFVAINMRLGIAQVPGEGIVFDETFEHQNYFAGAYSIEVGSWDYALQYVDSLAYMGKKSARFEIRKDQPLVKNGIRAEVVIIKKLPEKEMWYSFAVYFPSNGFTKDSEREVINQWYQNGSPATTLRARNDRIYLETGNEPDKRKQIDIGAIAKDSWHTFVLHFIHSYENDGLIEVWYDDQKVITHRGGNMYNDVLPKWKIGLYKAAFKYGTSALNKRVIFFDNIKVGNQNSSYEEMRPAREFH